MAAKKAKKMRAPIKADPFDDGIRKTAKEVLEGLLARNLGGLVEEVAAEFHCTPLEVCGTSRQVPIPDARVQLWSRLYSKDIGWSLPRIAEVYGVDHSTIIWQLKARKKRLGKKVKP